MNSAGTLTAKKLSVGWHGNAIARIEELSVGKGEIVVLAGPNGVGKSTTLKTIARQIMPLGGSVEIDGRDALTMPTVEFAKFVAYVPQVTEAPATMTVFDMVALGRNPHQQWWSWHRTPADDRAIQSALERTDALHLSDKQVGTLSGGELQRAAVAMALAQETSFLLLDEPTAHLDYKHQMNLVKLLGSLKSHGLGVLLVLHDLNVISRVADRLVLMRQSGEGFASEVQSSGAAKDVLTVENLRTVYGVDVTVVDHPSQAFKIFVPES